MLTWEPLGISGDQSWALEEEGAVCGNAVPQDMGLSGWMPFWGEKCGYLCGKWLDLGCLSSATCAGMMLGFITSLVSLQIFHETNVYFQG